MPPTFKRMIEKPVKVKDLFAYLNEWNLGNEVIDGVDAYELSQDLGVKYPWNPFTVSPTKYTGDFNGFQISHFVSVADGLVVWAVYGSCFDGETPDYDMDDWCVRIK